MTPDGWRIRAIGDFAQQISDRAGAEELPILSVSKDLGIVLQTEKFKRRIASDDTSNYKRVRFDQFVYDPMLLWAGNVGRQRRVPEGLVSPAYTVFEIGADVDPDFLLYFLKRPEMLYVYKGISRGTNVRRQKALFSDFAALSFPFPSPAEQRKIAAILSSVDDAIEASQGVIAQIQVVKKAIMADLLTKGLPGRHKKFKKTEVGEVPEEWEVCSIDSLGIETESTVRSGPFGSSMKTKDFAPTGVPVLTIQSLGHGELLREGLFYVGEEKARELAEYKVRPNDVVFSRVADIGRCAAISADEAGWLISPNLSRIRLNPKRADARFLMYLITTGASVLRQVKMVAGNAGRPVISSSTLRELRLPVPALPEQHAIAAAGQEFERRLSEEREFLTQVQKAKSALIFVLLTGEVRVRVDGERAA